MDKEKNITVRDKNTHESVRVESNKDTNSKEKNIHVEPENNVRENINSNKKVSGFIQFKNVIKSYPMGELQIKALDGVNFTINRGEIVIVVGESGAGKSTIMNIIGGMDRQSTGEVYVDNKEISAYSDKEMVLYRRRDVGFVFQFYNLIPNLTARENVELAAQVSENPLDVVKILKAVGLEKRMDSFPSQLSGGEQQRVSIARALVKNPKILLCDEPTGALDYNTGKSIISLIQEAARLTGMTVIIITHNYALTGIGNRIIKVKNGKIETVAINKRPKNIADIEW